MREYLVSAVMFSVRLEQGQEVLWVLTAERPPRVHVRHQYGRHHSRHRDLSHGDAVGTVPGPRPGPRHPLY